MHELIAQATKTLSLDGIPEEKQREIITRLGEIIWKRMIVDVLDTLSPEARAQCKILSNEGGHDDLYRFFTEQVPNFEKIAKTSAEKTVAEFLKK